MERIKTYRGGEVVAMVDQRKMLLSHWTLAPELASLSSGRKQLRLRGPRMLFLVVAALCLLIVTSTSHVYANGAEASHWVLSLGSTDYLLDAHGSALDGEGAHVELASSRNRTSPAGSSITSVDATAYRGHTIKLSGLISTTDAPAGAGLWLRADGPHGRLVYANSQGSLVKGTSSAQERDVAITVPPNTTTITFGTLLFGDGRASVDHLSLVRGDAISPGGTYRQ